MASNDPESISKERLFLNSLSPRLDVVMLQERKLMGRNLDNLEIGWTKSGQNHYSLQYIMKAMEFGKSNLGLMLRASPPAEV